jgi:hypothetical protein
MFGEHVSHTFGIIHTPAPLRARLRARPRRREPHWIDLDASRSRGGVFIDRYRFWVVDDRNGRLVYGPRRTDGPRHAVVLPPGRYRIFVEVEDIVGLTDVASQEVTVLPGVIVSESGALGSTWGMDSTFTLPSSASTADLSTLLGEASGASSSSAMWIQAFGAEGGHGGKIDIYEGGSSGAGGFAMWVGTLDGFSKTFGTTTLYYLLGQNGTHTDWGGGDGGASTVVAAETWPASLSAVVVIAGGSGGGGASGGAANGHDGGAGGTANSYHSLDAGVTGVGSSGNGGHAGGGGDGETGGSGGGSAASGTKGIGGWGGLGSGPEYPGWSNGEPTAYTEAPSRGGGGNCADTGGAGGGGYGGGGGGGTADVGCGGGGGGSYAAASTVYDADAGLVGTPSSGSATGVVKVSFITTAT